MCFGMVRYGRGSLGMERFVLERSGWAGKSLRVVVFRGMAVEVRLVTVR